MRIFKKTVNRFILLLFLLLGTSNLFAQHYKKDGTPDRRYKENRSSNYTTPHNSSTHHNANYVYGVQRDSHGQIKRSEASKRKFMKQTGYPKGRQGYVVDHIIPLKKGGCDCPSNMQWQTKEAAKAKDKWE